MQTQIFFISLCLMLHGALLMSLKDELWQKTLKNVVYEEDNFEKSELSSPPGENSVTRKKREGERGRKSKSHKKSSGVHFEYITESMAELISGYGDGSHLKSYKDNFYPPWMYFGFYNPSQWDKVPIGYFVTDSKEKIAPKSEKSHRSALRLCESGSKVIGDDVKQGTGPGGGGGDKGNPADSRGGGEGREKRNATNNGGEAGDADKKDTASPGGGNEGGSDGGGGANCSEVQKNECTNTMPSPIHILYELALEDENLGAIEFSNFGMYYGFLMFFPADGTDLLFVKLDVSSQEQPIPGIKKGPNGDELFLDRISIHFGPNPKKGSEHKIDDRKYGMELQFYFTPEPTSESENEYWDVLARYKTIDPDDPNFHKNLWILTVFVEVIPERSKDKKSTSKAMEVLSDAAEMFWDRKNPKKYRGTKTAEPVLSIEDFFHDPLKGIYYTYEGSLTHPPCLTHANWILFETPLTISRKTWQKFIFIRSEFSDRSYIAGNIRPLEHILVNAPIDVYAAMKKAQGHDLPPVLELERDLITTDPNGTWSIMKKYIDYENYFALKVKKSKIGAGGSGKVKSQNGPDDADYYDDVDDETVASGPGTVFLNYHYNYWATCFFWIIVQFYGAL